MKSIGVFFGGKNPEHDVSIVTGQLILDGLRKLGYTAVPIYIATDGTWHTDAALGSLRFFTARERNYGSSSRILIDLEASRGKMILRRKGLLGSASVIDIAFPALHGQYGEDGTLQGLFEMLDVPYVGCGVAASAIAMDKALTKLMYKALSLPTTDFRYYFKASWDDSELASIENSLPYPVFVKPARLGSSIGISKAKNKESLKRAIDVAFHYDTKIVVERGVENVMDVTCAVVGYGNSSTASKLQESNFAADFLSYDDKYLKEGGTQLSGAAPGVTIPASLDVETTTAIQSAAQTVFRQFELSGIARVDFLYDRIASKWFVNEINTLPGTLYHHLWKESGILLPELLERLLASAVQRHTDASSVTRTFSSSLMELAKSTKLRLKG